jgi:two-component system response regulator FixJ
MKKKVMIVDDAEAVRSSLKAVLETYNYDVVTYGDAGSAIESVFDEKPDCILLDVRMPDIDGLTAQRQLAAAVPHVPIILITGHGDIAMAVKAMKAGARDFIEKPIDDELLEQSIAAAIQDRSKQESRIREVAALSERYSRLTEREKTVASLVAEGHSSAAIASILSISIRTVDHHRANILAKMQATSVPHLIKLILQVSG